MEGESMRVMFEPWLVQNKVDIVFSGHVHSYERSVTISKGKKLAPFRNIYLLSHHFFFPFIF